MSYQEKLTADMKAAMKAGERDRLQVLRLLINDLKEQQFRSKKDALDESEELAVLQKAVKTRRDAIAQAEELGRDDVVTSERAEIEIIQSYLPAVMSPEELEQKVRELAAEIGYESPKDTGRFMKEWMARYKGRADGGQVQQALKNL